MWRYSKKTSRQLVAVEHIKVRFSPEEKQVWKEVAERAGHFIEERVLEALDPKDSTLKLPSWYVSSRLSTPDDDYKGIDIVVETNDLGRFFIQVKSSLKYVNKFLLGSTKTRIAIMVVFPNDTFQRIRAKFFQVARMERDWLKKRRSGSGERLPADRTLVY